MEFEYTINESITIRRKVYCPGIDYSYDDPDSIPAYGWLDSNISICIRGRWFDVLPLSIAYRAVNPDGYYRFIYIQINEETGEYYVGKVNRKRLSELKKYKGSGLKFQNKLKKHPDEFIMYYIARCQTAKETELLEAEIVNEELLRDPFCLNLVAGGGGTNEHYDYDRRQRQSEYMKAHPERYAALLQYLQDPPKDHEFIQRRSKKIKETMSTEPYIEMFKERMQNWRETCPEEYNVSRENNKASVRTEESRKKKSKSLKAYRKNKSEEYSINEEKRKLAANSPEARAKRSKSQKEWCAKHPEEVKRRAQISSEKKKKPVNMLDLNTGEVLKTFDGLNEAAEWLVNNNFAKTMNCKTSISAVCLNKPCTTGYGYRKKAYGFNWKYVNDGDQVVAK